MNHKVKELFNTLYLDEEKEHKTNPNSKVAKRKKPFIFKGHKFSAGTRIHVDFQADEYIKEFSDETYFVICPNNDLFFPVIWDELEINFTNKNIRFCKQCDKDIYKVDNIYLYNQCIDEYLCMAISTNTLNKLKNNILKDKYEELSDKLLVSKLFFAYENEKYNEQDEFYEKFKENNFTRELAFKTIILDILNTNNMKQTIEYYNQNGVDLEKIIFQVLPSINDEQFKVQVEEKIENQLKKRTNTNEKIY